VGTIRSGLEEVWELQGHQCLHQESLQPAPVLIEKPLSEWPVPRFINLFLPEFPLRPIRGQQQLKVGHWNPWEGSFSGRNVGKTDVICSALHFSVQILGLVAKGSFGTVLKVTDCAQKAVFAVKVGAIGTFPHSSHSCFQY
jgi:uncharacterized serine/threonine-protein kinase SgK494